jgi:hypothetical protein
MVENENPDLEQESKAPNCIRCRSRKIVWKRKTLGEVPGILVYCQSCGGVISWLPAALPR